MIVAQGADPDWACFYCLWEKTKPLSYLKPLPATPISQCSFHPNDNSVFCITGHGVMKVYRFIDNTLKLSQGSASTSITLAKKDQQVFNNNNNNNIKKKLTKMYRNICVTLGLLKNAFWLELIQGTYFFLKLLVNLKLHYLRVQLKEILSPQLYHILRF